MSLAAKRIQKSDHAHVESAHVERVGATFTLRNEGGVFEARRAKSCLVAPEPGDRVLCAFDASGAWVLAVLEGASEGTTLAADGDLSIRARGAASLTAARGIQLETPGDLGLGGTTVELRAERAAIVADETSVVGRKLRVGVDKLALVAKEVDSFVQRVALRAKRSFRFVEEIDQTRAGVVDLRSESLLGLRGENTVISSRTLTKVDGEQIHLG